MSYKDQIIHFSAGIHDYMGELDQAPHKMGKNWYRILNPCIVQHDETGRGFHLFAIQGNVELYKKYVDIRVPEDSIIEIRTVDPKGDLIKLYEQETARKRPSGIVLPNSTDMASLASKKPTIQ